MDVDGDRYVGIDINGGLVEMVDNPVVGEDREMIGDVSTILGELVSEVDNNVGKAGWTA